MSKMYINAVYYPNWRIYRDQPPSSLNLSIISHVFYAFARVADDGSICLSDAWADDQMDVDGQKGCLRAFAALKKQPHNRHLKVILSVGGGGEGSHGFPAMANQFELRRRFAASARAMVDKYELDGLDIDWEHPANPQEADDYLQLLRELRSAMPHIQYTLTSALPATEWALQHLNLFQAIQYLDYVNLMCYDYSGPWTPKSGHHAQLNFPSDPSGEPNTDRAVNYVYAMGVPRQKIVMGIPAYGRSFLGATASGDSYNGQAGEEGTFEYRELPRPGTTEQVDDECCAAYCIGGDGGFVTYDNPHTVHIKAVYAKRKGLAGLFYWTGTGDAQGDRSLVYNGFSELHGLFGGTS